MCKITDLMDSEKGKAKYSKNGDYGSVSLGVSTYRILYYKATPMKDTIMGPKNLKVTRFELTNNQVPNNIIQLLTQVVSDVREKRMAPHISKPLRRRK